MHEDEKDEQRTHVFYKEQINGEHATLQCAPVCELIFYHLVRYIPTHEQTREESAKWKEHLTCDEVEDVEQGLTKERQVLNASQRKRAERAHQTAARRDYLSCAAAGDAKLLLKECRADLMEGYQGSKGGKGEKGIEHQPHDIAHYRH